MRKLVLLIFLVSVAVLESVAAQIVSAGLNGSVTREDGSALPGVTVTIEGPGIRGSVAVTDSQGSFRFLHLPPGSYRVEARLAGFAPVSVEVVVDINRSTRVELIIPTGTSPPPPPPPPVEKATPPLIWNAWIESGAGPDPTFEVTTRLEIAEPYRVVLHLSAIEYFAGVISAAASLAFEDVIETWLQEKDEAFVEVLPLFDERFLRMNGDGEPRRLSVDLRKIRHFQSKGRSIQAVPEPLSLLKREANPEFLFGREVFHLHTMGRSGATAITFSFWANRRPVGELSLPVCIASEDEGLKECGDVVPRRVNYRGVDSLRTAVEDSQPPDISLHFVEFYRGTVRGVMRCRGENEDYVTWFLQDNTDDLYDYLTRTILPAFMPQPKIDDMELRQAGFGLYNLLFPRSPMTFGAQKARAALERCLSRGLASDPFAPGEPPSLFVRLLARSPKIRDVILPLGILAVGDTSATAKFLGFHYRIETPLDDQSYSAPGPCIDRWFLLVPSLDLKDPDLRSARERLGPWISEWESGAERSFQEMSDFQPWIERLGAETAPSALLVLSHHSDNRLSFGANGQSLSLNFARSFARPSLAVLNGCGTGGPGGAELIRKVNELGMMAVVATSTEVYPKMAGDFMNCLAQVLRDAPGTTIGTTYFDALRCLHGKAPQEKGKTYGAHVLAYTLLGNGNLKLCRPRKGDL